MPQTITATVMALDAIKDEPWSGPQGPVWFVQGRFKDGQGLFSIGSQSIEKAREKHAVLSALIDQEGQFEVEPKGEYQGHPKWKLLNWPGKPELQVPRGRPSGGGFQIRFRDTEEGQRREQESIHRSVALTQAVALVAALKPSSEPWDNMTLNTAERFYQWLQEPSRASLGQAQAGQHVSAPTLSGAAAGQPAAPTKVPPALKEMAAHFGITTGDRILTAREKYQEAITKAVKEKNTTWLSKAPQLIVQSCEAGTVNIDEAEELERELTAAKKALSSQTEYDRWYAQKVQEAQERERQAHGFGPQ